LERIVIELNGLKHGIKRVEERGKELAEESDDSVSPTIPFLEDIKKVSQLLILC
jgi:hypothetical protein